MKKLIILLLTLILIFCNFMSCNNKRHHSIDNEMISENTSEFMHEETSDTSETTKIDETHETEEYVDTIETIDGIDTGGAQNEYNYTLEKVGSQWYMIFDSYEHRPWNGQISEIYFDVNSVESFKNQIINNELGEWEKECIVANFERDDVGILIPNLDNILKPILPDGISVYQVSWYKEEYIISFWDGKLPSSEKAIDGTMSVMDEAGFTEKYNAAAKENIYVSEDGTKTIVLQQVKNQYIDRDYLYVKIGDDYALFELCGTPDYLDRDLIMSFGFEVLT